MPVHQHDDDNTCPACQVPWQQAGSVSRLRELTARFLEGSLRAHPGSLAGSVSAESEPLIADLAAINRAGLLTATSQPGCAGDFVQRAWVQGFATETVVDALTAATLDTDLLVLALPPRLLDGARVCVTRSGAKECTWAGAFDDPVAVYWNGSRQLAQQLSRLWCVDVIDPGWGRDGLLWSTVQAALTDRPVRRFFLEPASGEACSMHS